MLFIVVMLIVVALGGLWYVHNSRMQRLNVTAQSQIAQPAEKGLDQQRREFEELASKQKDKAEFDKAVERLNDIVRRWKDAYSLANSTARIALAGPVARLQEIRRETENTLVPECLEKAKGELLVGMNETNDAFIFFMQNSLPGVTDVVARKQLESAAEHIAAFSVEAKACGSAGV